MTLAEFKAWFQGFTENMDGDRPTAKQWKRIKARVKDIDGTPITPVIFERYVRRYEPYWTSQTTEWLSAGRMSASGKSDVSNKWHGASAMAALGQNEAKQLSTSHS